MNDVILIAATTLGGVGLISAVILYFVASKFKVFEDPKINEVVEVLPSANCGGCGFPGCKAFAEIIIKSAKEKKNLEGLRCPVGGNEVMKKVGDILGLVVEEMDPMIAVIRCNGSHNNSPAKLRYEGFSSCAFSHALYAGNGGCMFGCIGLRDCERVCAFEALYINQETGLPVVNDKCTACNACVIACPRGIIELRKKGPKDRRIFVSCINEEKGGPAKKNCEVACIGCSKCEKECKFEAITINNNVAYINFMKCTLCRKCVEVCPTNAIHEVNFKPTAGKEVVADNKLKTATKVEVAVEIETKEESKNFS